MNRAALCTALSAALATPLTLAGCAGTETGNAATGVPLSVRLALTAADGALIARDADGRAFTIDRAQGRVRRIDLSLPDDRTCADLAEAIVGGRCEGGHIRYTGPWTVDLLTGRAEPPIDALRAPAGVYRRIDVRFDSDDVGLALVVDGAAPTAAAARFTVLGDFGEDVRFEGQAAVLQGQAAAVLDLRLPVDAWLTGRPLAACIDGGEVPVADGVALIEEGVDGDCEAVVDDIRRAMKRDARVED